MLVATLGLAACGGDGDSATTAADALETPAEPGPVEETAQRPPPAAPDPGGHWISVDGMSRDGIQVSWAVVDDVERYELVRLGEAAVADPNAALPEQGEIIYSGPDNAYVDRDLTADAAYLYMIVPVLQDGQQLEPRWREAVAVDDTQAPSRVTGLTAERGADGVRLSWEPVSENYRFDSYDIRQLMADGEFEWIGGAYDITQTAFLDDRADPDAEITYELIARDFHYNLTEPTRITVPPTGG